jgi:hypothetical protein
MRKASSAEEIPEMKMHKSSHRYWLQYVPFVGLIYDMTMSPPTPSQIDRAIEIMVVVAALTLGAVASVMTAVTFDEIQAAMVRFNVPNDMSWHWCTQVSALSLAFPALNIVQVLSLCFLISVTRTCLNPHDVVWYTIARAMHKPHIHQLPFTPVYGHSV